LLPSQIEPDPPYVLILISVLLGIGSAFMWLADNGQVTGATCGVLGIAAVFASGGVIALEIRRRKP
jgi:hypothetical protein